MPVAEGGLPVTEVPHVDPDAVDAVVRPPHGGDPDPSVLDFSANTNPRTPVGVSRVYANALEQARRYPDDGYPAYREAAAAFVGCDPSRVVPTPGGLAAIRLILECCLESGDSAVVPFPSFGEYAREVRLQGATPTFVPAADLTTVDDRTLESATVLIACNPNNPTGKRTPRDALEGLLERCISADTILLVDEAFLGYTAARSMATRSSDHLAVARSLTKLFGLPGLRAGYAVSNGPLLGRLETARRTWCLGTPAAAVGAHCLDDAAFVRETRTRVRTERTRMQNALADDDRYRVFPSDAPYLLLAVDVVDELLDRTRTAGIAIRDARSFRGLDRHVRIAVKDRDSNDRLLEVMLDG